MDKVAEDRFEIYFAEKLWEMIPSIYRHEDGLAENSGVLRALVEVLAEQAAILRRSHDRLWDDQFIELCDDWAVPYIADLLGTRLVSALNKRGRRVDVAKTIYYRRRKGTLRILEELVSDISGWEGKVVENFRRLGRTRHGLDPFPKSLAGLFSETMPGGWADLRQPRVSELAGGPFDEFHHTADMRRHRGIDGRYGIPKLAFHLFRLAAFKIVNVTPFLRTDEKSFTFDPSGRDIPLFMPRHRNEESDWDKWHSAREWELPMPIPCRLLGHAEYDINESVIQILINGYGLSTAAADELRTLCSWRFRSESRLRETLQTFTYSTELLAIFLPMLSHALIEACGKKAILSSAITVDAGSPAGIISTEQIIACNLSNWNINAPAEKRLAIDPVQGRFLFLGAQPAGEVTATYHYGFSGEIGAGTYDRRKVEDSEPDLTNQGGGTILSTSILNDGITQINDSKTYGPIGNKINITNLILQAANYQRPYLRLTANWVLNTGTNSDSTLVLEGLWIGGDSNYEIILRGDYETVILSHTTLDPGGDTDADGNTIYPIPLVIEAQIEQLIVDACITGPIFTRNNGIVEKFIATDSIMQSIDRSIPALSLGEGEADMKRVTGFGSMEVHRLRASEVLITGLVDVTDTQNGCFRFSAALRNSRLPRPYESHFIVEANHYFSSSCFGRPGYGQLSETAPVELRRGAENGSEIGAFSNLINPIKLDSLRSKVQEYMPFGLIPIFIQET